MAAVLTAAGCHGGTPRATSADSAAATRSTSALPCGLGDGTARAVRITSSDGAGLAALEEGTGSRGVVLVPEAGPRGKCGWTDYAASLAASGLRVLMFDGPCQGGSSCPASGGDPGSAVAAAAARLRADGAAAVVLVGASAGATAALDAVAGGGVPAHAVVALSADELGGLPSKASSVSLPVLMAVAQDDRYVSVDDTRRLFAALGTASSRKSLEILPAGSGHGWDLLTDPAFSARVTAFVTANLAS